MIISLERGRRMLERLESMGHDVTRFTPYRSRTEQVIHGSFIFVEEEKRKSVLQKIVDVLQNYVQKETKGAEY